MKYIPCSLTILAASFTLLAGSTLAAERPPGAYAKTQGTSTYYVKPGIRKSQNNTRYQASPTKRKTLIKSRANRGLSLNAIRSGAIRQSLIDLQRLRPYATNYNELRSAVRAYWHRNITRPTTRGLAGTIMRHVKTFYKGFVRSEVYAGADAGIRKVKLALRNRRR